MNVPEVEVTWLDEVDSTSRLARDYLANHPKTIRAFAAKKQTAGTGRQGRAWESFEGNLHLSVAFPAAMVPDEVRDVLPLAAGVAVAKLLERAAGVRPVLKWPNDIVLNGAKIGGILCEATITGMTWNGAVIGIGINLVKAPVLSDYSTGTVLSATGIRLQPHLAAEALTRQLVHCVCDQTRDLLLTDFRTFATAPGQLWQSRQNKTLWMQEAFNDSGILSLSSLQDQKPLALTSADHDFSWTAQTEHRFLVADVGNSRVKLGLCVSDGNGVVIAKQVSWSPNGSDCESIADFVGGTVKDGVLPVVHVSSVNPKHFDRLAECLLTLDVRVRVLSKRALRSFSSRYNLGAIGMDRFAAIEAALALRAVGTVSGPLVLVSAGTATTIDLIDDSGIHRGGFIGPGVQLGLEAMHRGTAGLPQISSSELLPPKDWSVIPLETSGAMFHAGLRMQAAWIEREAMEWSKTLGGKPEHTRIVMTGGHATDISQLLSEQYHSQLFLAPELGLIGAGILTINGA